jgi:hypothetical protein
MPETCEERIHNHFSHILVPRLAFSDPEALYQDLSDGSEGLQKLWCALSSEWAGAVPLRVTRGRNPESHETFLVQMPRLEAESLAVAMAVVFERTDSGAVFFPHRVRYFTLERGQSLETGSPRHYLCEWEPDRGHANWGMLPGPDGDEFLRQVQAVLLTPSG